MAELPFPEAVPELGISLHYPFGKGLRHENQSVLIFIFYKGQRRPAKSSKTRNTIEESYTWKIRFQPPLLFPVCSFKRLEQFSHQQPGIFCKFFMHRLLSLPVLVFLF